MKHRDVDRMLRFVRIVTGFDASEFVEKDDAGPFLELSPALKRAATDQAAAAADEETQA